MKRKLLFLSLVISSATFAQNCSDLFISEYVEGWSNNKALEIYNPTGQTIDLSQYMIVRYSNGATTATSANAVQLVGTVAAYDVHVGVIEKLDSMGTGQEAPVWDSLQVRADEFYCPVYTTSNAWYWNGNDAIVLYRGTVNDIAGAQIVDVFGKLGEDPSNGVDYNGWTTDFPYVQTGIDVTTDHSLIRKATVLQGTTNPVPAYFNPLLEYDSIPAVIDIGGQLYGNWSSLGEHTCECLVSVEEQKIEVSISPNPTNTGNVVVKGLNGIEQIIIVDALGQEVNRVTLKGNAVENVYVSEINGLYILRFVADDKTVTSKRVIVK